MLVFRIGNAVGQLRKNLGVAAMADVVVQQHRRPLIALRIGLHALNVYGKDGLPRSGHIVVVLPTVVVRQRRQHNHVLPVIA